MNSYLSKMLEFAEDSVRKHDIYVWGAKGQGNLTEKWIREKEKNTGKDNNGNLYSDLAVEYWEKGLSKGYNSMVAYDCSGFISKMLLLVKCLDKRRDCDGLWDRCSRITKPVNGALLFRSNPKNDEDETHVGIYFNGKQYHAKGRAYGVVCETYKASYWDKIGWVKLVPSNEILPLIPSSGATAEIVSGGTDNSSQSIINEADDLTPGIYDDYVEIVYKNGRVNIRNLPKTGKVIYIAKYGEKLTLGDIDEETGWYGVETKSGLGFITNNPKYVKLVKKNSNE
jgi:hypothetical protein